SFQKRGLGGEVGLGTLVCVHAVVGGGQGGRMVLVVDVDVEGDHGPESAAVVLQLQFKVQLPFGGVVRVAGLGELESDFGVSVRGSDVQRNAECSAGHWIGPF